MDGKSLFLTANADTIYFVSFIDLSKGPMVLETRPDIQNTFRELMHSSRSRKGAITMCASQGPLDLLLDGEGNESD
jgi:hypothetical protein